MTTQSLTLLPAEPVLQQLADLRQLLERTLATHEQNDPAWLPLNKLCHHFGLSRKSMQLHLVRARSARAIRVLQPTLPSGTVCNPLYNVADLTAYLASTTPSAK